MGGHVSVYNELKSILIVNFNMNLVYLIPVVYKMNELRGR